MDASPPNRIAERELVDGETFLREVVAGYPRLAAICHPMPAPCPTAQAPNAVSASGAFSSMRYNAPVRHCA